MDFPRSLQLTLAALALSACSDGGGGNGAPPPDLAPTVSAIGDTTVQANSAERRIGFSVSDDETRAAALAVTVAADSDELFGDDSPAVTGTGGDRELLITPAPGTVGTARITVTVTDGAGQDATTSFVYTVAPQQIAFDTAARAAFGANENDDPQTVNDKEYMDNGTTYDDLLRD